MQKPWWDIFGRLSDLELEKEWMMAQLDDLNAARDRLISSNRRLIAKVGELQAELAAATASTDTQAVIDDMNNAAAAAEAIVPAPAPVPEETVV